MQQHGSIVFGTHAPKTLEMGSVGQNSTFSEHGHVTYPELKRITNAVTWKQRFIPQTLLTLGMGSIGQISTFLEHGHAAYQINENYE